MHVATSKHKRMFDKACKNPSGFFDSPMEVSEDKRFSSKEKLEILKCWTEQAQNNQKSKRTGKSGKGLIGTYS